MDNPDFRWYSNISSRNHVTASCPIAACDKCPRHYLSLKLVNTVYPGALSLSADSCAGLEEKWRYSPPFVNDDLSCAVTPTASGAIAGVEGFCPEVTAKYLGLYCSSLREYVDEDHKRSAKSELCDMRVAESDPRHVWATCRPQHFIECGEYSIYCENSVRKTSTKKTQKTVSNRVRWEVFSRDNFTCQYCGKTGKTGVPLQVDHRVPRAAGGSDDIGNLVTACEECNNGKGVRKV